MATNSNPLSSQIEMARQAGYSDDDITQHLMGHPTLGPQIKEAVGAGYQPSAIVNHIWASAVPKPPIPAGLVDPNKIKGSTAAGPVDTQTGRKVSFRGEYPSPSPMLEGTEQIAGASTRSDPTSSSQVGAPESIPGLTGPQTPDSRSTGQRAVGGVNKIISGAAEAAAPVAIPAAVTTLGPAATAYGIGAGAVKQKIVQKGLELANVSPEYAELAGDIAGGYGGYRSAKGAPRVGKTIAAGARAIEKTDLIHPLKAVPDIVRASYQAWKSSSPGAMADAARANYLESVAKETTGKSFGALTRARQSQVIDYADNKLPVEAKADMEASQAGKIYQAPPEFDPAAKRPGLKPAKFGGPADPDYSPPTGPVVRKVGSVPKDPVTGSEVTPFPKGKGTGTKYGGAYEPDYSQPSGPLTRQTGRAVPDQPLVPGDVSPVDAAQPGYDPAAKRPGLKPAKFTPGGDSGGGSSSRSVRRGINRAVGRVPDTEATQALGEDEEGINTSASGGDQFPPKVSDNPKHQDIYAKNYRDMVSKYKPAPADLRLVKGLKEKGISQSDFDNATDSVRDAWKKSLGFRKSANNRDSIISDLLSEDIPHFAQGGIISKPTVGLIGEVGPEMRIPLIPKADKSQMQQLASGQRKFVMIPKGDNLPPRPKGMKEYRDASGNTYVFNPSLTSQPEIDKGTEHQTQEATPQNPDQEMAAKKDLEDVKPADKSVDKIRGSINVPLDEEGIQQADHLGRRFVAKGGVHRIISSDMLRARQTAEGIRKYSPNASVIYTKNLEPWPLGGLEGLPTEQVLPELKRLVLKSPAEVPQGMGPGSTRPAQSFNRFAQRSLSEVARRKEEHDRVAPNEVWVLTAHKSILSLTQAWAQKGAPNSLMLDRNHFFRSGDDPGSVIQIDKNKKIKLIDMEAAGNLPPDVYIARHGSTSFNKPSSSGTKGKSVS